MGSSSSNRTTSQTSYLTTTENANIQGNQGVALANSQGNTVNVLDGGAIEQAFNLGGKSVDMAGNIAVTAIDQSGQNLSKILGFSESVIDKSGARMKASVEAVKGAFEAARSSSQEDVLKIGLVLVGGVVVASMVARK